MKKQNKLIIGILIIIVAVLAIVSYVYMNNSDNTSLATGETNLELTADAPESLGTEIQYLKTEGNNGAMNNTTLSWLEKLNDNVYFIGDSGWVIMNQSEAKKLPVLGADDPNKTYYNTISCDIVENRSLGNGFDDCILVKNVKVVGNKTVSN